MSKCYLCPRACGVDRQNNIGFCGVNNKIKIAKADLHFWEEPCISGKNGSGTIFFSGCSLSCVFCQNDSLSKNYFGKEISGDRFYSILFELQQKGANNINLVTADHFLPQIVPVLKKAKQNGLHIPVLLNTSSYLKEEVLHSLSDVIDVYIADLKFFDNKISEKYCKSFDYPDIAKKAIKLMYSMTGTPKYDENGMLIKGIIVRVLVLPGNIIDAKRSINYILSTYSDQVILSIMSQYTPVAKSEFPELLRPLTDYEYKSVVNYSLAHGFKNGYIQQKESNSEKYIPMFDLKGV